MRRKRLTYSEHKKNIGITFNRLTVVGVCIKEIYGQEKTHYICNCCCGNTTTILAIRILNENTRSCGCLNTEDKVKHRMCGTAEYLAYIDAKRRCINVKNKHYKDYGGRGIMFLFESFVEFYKEIGKRTSPIHQLDRIDNDGNYEKGNVRWATPKENANNRRKN